MKRFIAALALLAFGAPAVAKDVTIGLSWDARESALNQAWEDYMRAEAKGSATPTGSTSNGLSTWRITTPAVRPRILRTSSTAASTSSSHGLSIGGDRGVNSCGQGCKDSVCDLR